MNARIVFLFTDLTIHEVLPGKVHVQCSADTSKKEISCIGGLSLSTRVIQ